MKDQKWNNLNCISRNNNNNDNIGWRNSRNSFAGRPF